MTTVMEAIARIGVDLPEEGEMCVGSRRDADSEFRFRPLSQVADLRMDELGEVYLSGGAFTPGSLAGNRGRTRQNVSHVLWLAFDADLKSFLSVDGDVLYRQGTDVDRLIANDLLPELESAFASAGVPIHRLDSTGYGLCAYVNVAPDEREDVAGWAAVYPRLVRRINAAAGGDLLDPQVSDAGTRVTKLPGSLNTKGRNAFADDRVCQLLFRSDGFLTLAEAEALAGEEQRPAPAPPPETHELGGAMLDHIVAAIRPEWREGARHQIAVGLAGMLAKAGVTEEQAALIVSRCAEGDPEWADRMAAVRTTYGRMRSGRDVRGWHNLQDVVGEGALRAVDGVLEPLRRANAPRLTVLRELPPEGDDAYTFDPVPDACWQGWIAEYRDLMEPTTEAPAAFHLGVGLTVAGAVLGRSVGADYAGATVYGNLYSLIVGKAGRSRKDTAIRRGVYWQRIVPDAGAPHGMEPQAAPYEVLTDAGSAQGLIEALSQRSTAILYLSEFAKLTRNARRSGTADIMPTITQAWDNPDELRNLVAGRTAATATNPCLSILAAVQPAVLAVEFGEGDTAIGLTSRFLFFCGEARADALPDPPRPDAARLKALYLRLRDRAQRGGTLRLTPEADEAWLGWYLRQHRVRHESETRDTMASRLGTYIRKVALVYAGGEGADAIDRRHLDAATALVEWQWGNVCKMSPYWGASVGNTLERRIVDTLAACGGALPRADLRRRVQSERWGPEEFARIVKAMQDNGTLVADAGGRVGLAS